VKDECCWVHVALTVPVDHVCGTVPIATAKCEQTSDNRKVFESMVMLKVIIYS